MKIIDITLPLSEHTLPWEGEQGLKFQRTMQIAEGDDYNVTRCELSVHTGTHIDAPFHVFKSGRTIESISLKKMVGKAQVIEIPHDVNVIDADCLQNLDIDPDVRKILFKTTNSDFWNQEPAAFQRDFVALNTSGAEYLAALDLDLVGIDYFSISMYDDLLAPHRVLMDAEMVILENADLREVEAGTYQLFCLPLKFSGTDGAPVRAILTD